MSVAATNVVVVLVDRLLAFGPHAGAHRPAVRAGVSILVPLLVLLSIHHLSWSIYAAFGAFTALYGRERTGRHRGRLQVVAGLILTACVCLGVVVGASPDRGWLAVPVAAVVACLCAAESARAGWHPPGALFQIFAFASVASVPSRLGDVGTAAVVAGASAAFAVVIGGLGHTARSLRSLGSLPGPLGHVPGEVLAMPHGRWPYAALYGGGVLVAGTLATGAGIGRPYWAMVGAAVPLAAREFLPGLVRGLHRIIGTAVGLLIAWGLLSLHLHGIVVVLAVAALQATSELLVGRNYAVALMAVTPLALLMIAMVAPAGGPSTGRLLLDRGVETLIGAAVGILIGWLAHRARLVRTS